MHKEYYKAILQLQNAYRPSCHEYWSQIFTEHSLVFFNFMYVETFYVCKTYNVLCESGLVVASLNFDELYA